jgi:hypothetical protein
LYQSPTRNIDSISRSSRFDYCSFAAQQSVLQHNRGKSGHHNARAIRSLLAQSATLAALGKPAVEADFSPTRMLLLLHATLYGIGACTKDDAARGICRQARSHPRLEQFDIAGSHRGDRRADTRA